MKVVDQDTGQDFFLESTPELQNDMGPLQAPCTHSRKELRQRINRGGAVQYIDQCLQCGESIGMFHKHSENIKSSPAWDAQLSNSFHEGRKQQRSAIIQKHVRIRRGRTEGFWKEYNKYLQSDAWAKLRIKVFNRANGQCEGCQAKKATQVHHLSYKNVFKEFLFELVAVCDDCHDRLHPKDGEDDLAQEWSEAFPCNACRYSTEEQDRKWCGKFDELAVSALAPDGECGPNHSELEGLK